MEDTGERFALAQGRCRAGQVGPLWGQVVTHAAFLWTKWQCPPSLFLSDSPLELRADLTPVQAVFFPASWGLDVTALRWWCSGKQGMPGTGATTPQMPRGPAATCTEGVNVSAPSCCCL